MSYLSSSLIIRSLLPLLLFVGSLGATDYSCAGPGERDWNTATDWMPIGVPGALDTATIESGCAMRCADFCQVASVALQGELDIDGTLTLEPGDGLAAINTEGGTPVLEFVGTLNCDRSEGGSCQINHGSQWSGQIPDIEADGELSNFGGPSLPAVKLDDGQVPVRWGWHSHGALFHSDGAILLGWNSPTTDMTFDGVTFAEPQDVSGASNPRRVLQVTNTAANPTGDRTFRIAASNLDPHEYWIDLNMPTQQGQQIVAYNVGIVTTQPKTALQGVLSVIDRAVAPGIASTTSIEPAYNCDDVFSIIVAFNQTPNAHSVQGLNQPCSAGTKNTYSKLVFDGNGYGCAYDCGDDYQDDGNYVASYGLHINASGTWFTLSDSANQSGAFDNEVVYHSFAGALCELFCWPWQLVKITNSWFVSPSTLAYYPDAASGMFASHSFNLRQAAISSGTDHNYFWDIPQIGQHLLLNGVPSWPELPSAESNMFAGAVTISGGTSVTCANCFAMARKGDFLVDPVRNSYAMIQAVSSSSAATIATTLSGYQPTDVVDVRFGYFADGGFYGVDWGAHDQRLNPFFRDSTRTVCKWWQQQSGSAGICPYGSDYTATAGTSGTTINDSTVDFDALNVADGTDVVAVYSSDFKTFKGDSVVTWHSSTALALEDDLGIVQGDRFTFITAPKLLGRTAVQVYGYDVYGNQVTPPAWARPDIASDIRSYLAVGFTPTNPSLVRLATK